MRKIIFITAMLLFYYQAGYALDISECIIQNDIGTYKKIYDGVMGDGSGVLALAGHFGGDHADVSCEISYSDAVWVDVMVSRHIGGDSDQWLLHEIEDIYRRDDRMGELLDNTIIKEINGNKVYFWISYTWLSGNNVIYIKWIPEPDIDNSEPLDVVNAYLAQYPSTITITDVDLQSRDHNEKWIKDEMERRLWLCDKWIAHNQAGHTDKDTMLEELHDNMKVFLNYKEKYFGIESANERNIIFGYMQTKDEAAMKNKLTEYQSWWSANKDGAINLP